MAFRAQRYSAEQWNGLVSEYNQSGETVHAFCDRHQLGFSTFNRWRRRFSTPITPGETPSPRNSFVEAIATDTGSPVVTLHIGQSIWLSLPGSLGVELIAELAQAVASRVRG